MSTVYVGIDLAKNVFALHGVNATGAVHSFMQPNVAHERPSRRAKPACEGPSRWAG